MENEAILYNRRTIMKARGQKTKRHINSIAIKIGLESNINLLKYRQEEFINQ